MLIQLITLTTLFISKNGLKKDDVYLSTTYGETEYSSKESKDHYDIYCHNNFIFNDSLNTVSNNSDRKTFRFIELAGAHPPYDVTADFRMDAENASKMSTGQGLLVMLENYKNALKEKGVYDNTTIIVLGDHGKELLWNPVFMIKPANAKHELIVDVTPFSYQSLQELYVGITDGEDEDGIRGIISSHKDMKRRYLKYESGDGKNEEDYFGSDIVECEVIGRADREGAIIPTDTVYLEHRK